uniref:Uncharacterized protein n=1 Tax=Lotharella oceanica TaxID=641309 RepID=A0A7S2TKT2_9EUKA
MASAVVVAAEAATESGACALVDNPSRIPLYMPDVGTTKLHEDEMSVVWNLTIPAGTRLPPHEHMYDYSFHVLEGSTLAVYSGQDGKHIFSFDAPTGHTMSFKREGEMMVDITGAIPPFPAVHGVKNVGEGNYREMLFETKPCKSVPHGEYARRYDNEDMRRIFLAKDGAAAKTHHDGAKILANSENVNDETEKKFTKGYTHGMLLSLDASARDRTPDIPVDALVLDFYPQLVKDAGAEEGMKRVKHMVLVRFKPETPVGEMVAGYIGLTTKISEMKGFNPYCMILHYHPCPLTSAHAHHTNSLIRCHPPRPYM